jgi:hypothetical protein
MWIDTNERDTTREQLKYIWIHWYTFNGCRTHNYEIVIVGHIQRHTRKICNYVINFGDGQDLDNDTKNISEKKFERSVEK